MSSPITDHYAVLAKDQAGALAVLAEIGALHEIEAAILGHCAAHYPDPPPYRPGEIKTLLKPHGWLIETRVPMLSAAIERFVAAYNARAQPFVWTKPAAAVLATAIKPNTTSETEH